VPLHRALLRAFQLHLHLPATYAYGYSDDYAQANAYAQAAYNAEGATHPAAAPVIWGAQAASLHVSAACRDGKMEIIQLTVFNMLPAGLPATTG